MKKMFPKKVILFFLLGILIGATVSFCMMLTVWPEQTSTVQPVDTEME